MPQFFFKPIGNKVVVEQCKAEEKTAGGIHLPDTAKEKPKRGRVRAIGTGKILDNGEKSPMQVSVGNEVVYTTYAGHEITRDQDTFLVLDESDILGIVS